MFRRTIFIIGFLGACLLQVASAAPEDFPRSPALIPQIEFWKDVFTKHTKYHVVLHDERHLNKIIEVIDYRPLAPSTLDDNRLRKWINEQADQVMAETKEAFWTAHVAGNNPSKLEGRARRIWELYKSGKEPNKYLAARDRLRYQRGVRESFASAIVESARYLPQMEAEFRELGLPVELTRLPFIESSFNVKAYSHAGAAGIWQFMPSSARLYMRLNNTVDDRRDPWFSTEAAARHLRDDYRMLKSWPLAITAYNFGRNGMARAVKAVGSDDITDIIRGYRGPRFGFAGRNFYAEFCAAVDIAAEPEKYFGAMARAPETLFDEVLTPHHVPYETLRTLSGLPAQTFAALNPAYRPEVVSGKQLVPQGHRIRVPHGQAAVFTVALRGQSQAILAAIAKNERGVAARHKVKSGETLISIAHRYETDSKSLQQANGINNAKMLRVGQLLRLPSRDIVDGGTLSEKAADRKKVGENRQLLGVKQPNPIVEHRIERGHTLDAIAKRYKTNPEAIQKANALTGTRIQAGKTLKVPVGDNYVAINADDEPSEGARITPN